MKITLFRDLPTEYWLSMERYADELARGLIELGCDIESFVPQRPLSQLRGTLNSLANYAWRSFIYPLQASKNQGDLNHIIDHSYAHLLHSLDASRTLVTCHDLAPLALNEGKGVGRRLWNDSFHAMLSAEHIIADSKFTRAEILRLSNYPAEKISVVPLAISKEFFEPVPETVVNTLRVQFQLTNRLVILHVGTCAPRKNIDLILKALKDLLDLEFVFVQIGGQFSTAQLDLITSLSLRKHVIQLPPTFGQSLSNWYHAADVFVFPSLYEGFGMPLAEAMASGAPSISTHASSLPEVAGDAAILVNPHDSHALAEAVRRVLTDQQLRHELIEKGLNRAKIFTWQRTAYETRTVYQKLKPNL